MHTVLLRFLFVKIKFQINSFLSHLVQILHYKFQFYILMFEASNMAKGQKDQAEQMLSLGAVSFSSSQSFWNAEKAAHWVKTFYFLSYIENRSDPTKVKLWAGSKRQIKHRETRATRQKCSHDVLYFSFLKCVTFPSDPSDARKKDLVQEIKDLLGAFLQCGSSFSMFCFLSCQDGLHDACFAQ